MTQNDILREIETLLRSSIRVDDKFKFYWQECSHPLREIVRECIGRPYTNDPHSLLGYLMTGMDDFLQAYPVSPVYKELMAATFKIWLKDVRRHCGESSGYTEEDIEKSFTQYIKTDTGIALLKALHPSNDKDHPGKSRAELAEETCLKAETVRRELPKLCSDLSGNMNQEPVPFRFGGQILSAKIECEERPCRGGAEKFYYTKNTVHPIALQLNMMQVGCMLKSLSAAYAADITRVSLQIAAEIWIQLSDYAKKRVKEMFAARDAGLQAFIGRLESIACGDELPLFDSEDDMNHDEQNTNPADRLLMAFKSGRRCDVSFFTADGKTMIKRNQRIIPEPANSEIRYRLTDFSGSSPETEGILLSEDQITGIELY